MTPRPRSSRGAAGRERRATLRPEAVILALAIALGCGPGPQPTPGSEPPPPAPGTLRVTPSPHVPSAFRVEWTGPAGDAALWVAAGERTTFDPADPAWTLHAEAPVDDGPGRLTAHLLPPGRWAVVVVVDEGASLTSDLATLTVPAPPAAVGTLTVTHVDADRSLAAHGLLLFHPRDPDPDRDYVVIADGQGRVVWWRNQAGDGAEVMRARPSADGRSIVVLLDRPGSEDAIERVSLDGESITTTVVPDATHDVVENADGTFTFIGYTFGERGSLDGLPFPVATDRIRTVAEGADDGDPLTDGFDFLEDYPVGPWRACPDVVPNGWVPGAVEWTHSNSLMRSPGDDGWWLLARWLDAVLAVTDEGAIRWQLGGREATLAPTTPEAAFHHGHASHAWREADGDHLLVFDNGNHTPEPIVSRVVEYVVDPGTGTYTLVWSLPDPQGWFSPALGDARRLDNGNTLVTWPSRGQMSEYTPSGEEVFRLDLSLRAGRAFLWPAPR